MTVETFSDGEVRISATKSALIERRFTKPGIDPLDEVVWEKRNSLITDPDGTVVFEMKDVEVPAGWSQLATDIAVSKYFRKAGLHGDPNQGETSVRQLVRRVARTIRKAGEQLGGYFKDNEAEIFEAELTYILVHQLAAFNSPVWFNVGLFHEYGIKGQGGNWYWEEENRIAGYDPVIQTENAYEHPQSAACFLTSVQDDLMSIYDLVKTEARLFKGGSGTGTNFSKVRGKQEKLSSGGKSSGLMSFLEVLDRAAGAIKSGGTTRRAAKMVCLDLDHPEIVDFIQWKSREEKKAKALIEKGYTADFNGDAYHTVGGQNSNNSVRLTDEFMNAVVNDGVWHTRARTTGDVVDTYKARDLWKMICESAWECADPGVQFDTTTNEWHTVPNSGRINESNPCGEYLHLSDTACNLASINLTKFSTLDGVIDLNGYRHVIRTMIVAQEILVDFASYPTYEITKNSHNFRPLGLGYANLGALLMRLGHPYDSAKGREVAGQLTAILTGCAYGVSAEIAERKGPFPGFEKNREPMLDVMCKHQKYAHAMSEAKEDWKHAITLGEKFGYRNAQISVCAPTGTIGLLMDCDTTGIEPDFSLVKFKKLSGGGTMKIVNQSVMVALSNLGYAPSPIEEIQKYIEKNMTIEGAPHLKSEHLAVFDCANRGGDGKRFIEPMGHVRMLAATTPFWSGGISKTINCPNETTIEQISDLYMQSWKMGLKSVALYRDGCKASQPLNSAKAAPGVILQTPQKRKLPNRRKGFTQKARVAGNKLFIRTGEYEDGTLGEIFLDMHKEGAAFRSLMNALAQAVSMGLQHGVPLEAYVNQFTFTRFEPSGVVEGHPHIKIATSIIDYIFRHLGIEYLKDYDLAHVQPEAIEQAMGTPSIPPPGQGNGVYKNMMGDAPMCDQCGHITVRNASCYRCLNCGNSMGCS